MVWRAGDPINSPSLGDNPDQTSQTWFDGQYNDLLTKNKALQNQIDSTKGANAGYGGMGYAPITGVPGIPNEFFGPQGYGGAAQDILKGSINADSQLHDAYDAILRHKTEGIFGAYGEESDRASSQAAASGYSPELARAATTQRSALAQQQFGEAAGGAESDLHSALAELIKGTGTELAGQKNFEVGSLLNALVGERTAAAASKGQGVSAFGSLLGGLGKLAGGLAIAA